MAYGDFKDLNRRTAADKVLLDKAFNIDKNPKYNGYQHGLASMVYKFFDKISVVLEDKSAFGSGIKNGNISNQKLTEELHKSITCLKISKNNVRLCHQYQYLRCHEYQY